MFNKKIISHAPFQKITFPPIFKSFIGPQVNNIHINKNDYTITYIYFVAGELRLFSHELPWFRKIMIRFKRWAMCLYGAQKCRRVAAVAVGEQEAETWRQSLQSEIQQVLDSIM